MAPGSTGAPPLDLPALLGTAVLRLAPDLRTAPTRGSLLAVKHDASGSLLVVARSQWQLLERFTAGCTVPEALCAIIADEHCPPLREFYALVVQAHEHGILRVDGLPLPPPVGPVRWRVPLPPAPARLGALVLLTLSTLVLALAGVRLPSHAREVLGGALLALATPSLGQLLAACVLAGAGCRVLRPKFHWKTAVPGFRLDLEEAVMGGRDTEINVALVRLVPPFLGAALATVKAPPYALPLLVVGIVLLSPLWRTPGWDLLRALFRDPRLATRTRFVFARSVPFAVLATARRQLSDRRFLLAGTIATLVWLALVFVIGCLLFQAHAVDLLHRFYLAGGLRYTGIVMVGAVAAVILGVIGLVLWILVGHVLAWFRARAARARRLQIAGRSPEAVAELLAGIVLFRDLPPEARREAAAAMRPLEPARGDLVLRAGDPADAVYVVVSGRLEVIRHLADGRAEPVADLVAGDVLGEMAVVRGGPRTRSVRCATRSLLLALAKPDFDRIAFAHLTHAAVEDAVNKVGFLQNIALVQQWPQPSLAAFAKLARIQEYNEGDLVVREGSENVHLYLVHRGEFAVSQHGKPVRKLRPGDSYGEFGLLQNRVATTSVAATLPGSCLVVAKADFLKFITQDIALSLQFEQLGTRELGRRPAGGAHAPGFDVLRA